MMMNTSNNQAVLCGIALKEPTLSHKVHELSFYQFPLCVPRLSGQEDIIQVLCTWDAIETCEITTGSRIRINGEIRSFNNRSGIGNRLIISLFAREINLTTDEFCNEVTLFGAICKPPILRRTPLGKDITDLLLAVNRKYHRADYLPCIAWGSIAISCANLDVGDFLHINGRLQSRNYTKQINNIQTEHTAYEISIMALELPEITEEEDG